MTSAEPARASLAPMTLAVTGITLIAFGIPLLAPGPSNAPTSRTTTRPGIAAPLWDAGTTAATAAARARVERTPQDAGAWAALGTAVVRRGGALGDAGDYRRAEAALRRSLVLRPQGNAAAVAGMGRLAVARHDFTRALTWARRAIALQPREPAGYEVLDDAHTGLGNYPDAAEAAGLLLGLRQDSPALVRVAAHQSLAGHITEARRTLRRALAAAQVPTQTALARTRLGDLALGDGSAAAALREYSDGLRATPGDTGLLARRARALTALGRNADALHDWATVMRQAPDPAHRLAYADLLLALDRDDEAQAQLDALTAQLAEADADGVLTDLPRAVMEADHGSATAAVRRARAAWARGRSVEAEDALAWALHRAGRDREALPHAVSANRLAVPVALRRYHLGMIELASGHEPAARRDLLAALRIDPRFCPRRAPAARRALATLARA